MSATMVQFVFLTRPSAIIDLYLSPKNKCTFTKLTAKKKLQCSINQIRNWSTAAKQKYRMLMLTDPPVFHEEDAMDNMNPVSPQPPQGLFNETFYCSHAHMQYQILLSRTRRKDVVTIAN
jgi:hypothetical protein